MPSTTEFYNGTDWQQSSEPFLAVNVHEADAWPVDDNSVAGGKDVLADGLHPVVAIGGRTAADGRPLNLTGVVVTYTPGLTVATGIAVVNIANGAIVRQYVANILTYGGVTYEQTPVVGQPVYVDDSAALGAGVTLSMSPLNSAGTRNPLAGYLWYAQDEYADASVGGSRAAATFDTTLANSLVQQVYAVLLVNAARELS
jgi:hypothetical protein